MDQMISAVLFDLDNTLSDRDEAFSRWAHWFARDRLGLAADADVAEAVATIMLLDGGGYTPREALFGAIKERHAWLVGEVDALVREYRDQVVTYLPPLDDGSAGLLAALREAGVPWGIVTNGSSLNQRAKIRQLNLEDDAHDIVISEEVGPWKPDPAIFHLAAERLGVPAPEILFVGDHPENDVAGAARAGMQTAWLCRGRSWPAELLPVSPNYIADSLHELRWAALGSMGPEHSSLQNMACAKFPREP
jgi:putative hydrolase of the HAD superfamily